ncbi:MAG TPA: antibiotic biosynthesis monooxygenase [Chryseolinea sp.]
MITRIWHGRTALKNAASYLQFLLHEGTREYLQTPGNLSVKVWQKMEADCCHFWTVTEWTDIEAIKKFAGEDYGKAKYYPEDEGILLEFEEGVEHCESFVVGG